MYMSRTQLTSIFEGQPLKTRPFPSKTRVIWVLGKNIDLSKIEKFATWGGGDPKSQIITNRNLILFGNTHPLVNHLFGLGGVLGGSSQLPSS